VPRSASQPCCRRLRATHPRAAATRARPLHWGRPTLRPAASSRARRRRRVHLALVGTGMWTRCRRALHGQNGADECSTLLRFRHSDGQEAAGVRDLQRLPVMPVVRPAMPQQAGSRPVRDGVQRCTGALLQDNTQGDHGQEVHAPLFWLLGTHAMVASCLPRPFCRTAASPAAALSASCFRLG